MEIVELEIARHNWSALQCGCKGSASHVAATLLRLARAETDEEASFEGIDGHVFAPSVLYELAVPVVSVALASLADDLSSVARNSFLELLLLLVSGEGQSPEAVRQGRDLPNECVATARNGIWLLYSEMFSGRSVDSAGYAYEALTLIEPDTTRLNRAQAAAGDRLPWDLRES